MEWHADHGGIVSSGLRLVVHLVWKISALKWAQLVEWGRKNRSRVIFHSNLTLNQGRDACIQDVCQNFTRARCAGGLDLKPCKWSGFWSRRSWINDIWGESCSHIHFLGISSAQIRNFHPNLPKVVYYLTRPWWKSYLFYAVAAFCRVAKRLRLISYLIVLKLCTWAISCDEL